jgi:NAD(P)-dependent dehydrogenase (short-subunit alcohol dehydrogenase family)
MSWTSDELPDLTGTTAVVTGANSGIGFETVCALAAHGAGVTLACRDVAAAEQAADRIRSSHSGAEVRVAMLDLSSLASVRSFAEAWKGPLDLLVNNAGVMAPRTWQGTPDGFELQPAPGRACMPRP